MADELIIFNDPDMEFNVTDSLSNELYLENGIDFIVMLDESSDNEIIEWAENNVYIDDYLNDDGSLDLDALRDIKEEADLLEYNENPPAYATPSGRAFEWFENLGLILPKDVKLIDGEHPGSNYRGVCIKNINYLFSLQKFLFVKGYRVNFTITK